MSIKPSIHILNAKDTFFMERLIDMHEICFGKEKTRLEIKEMIKFDINDPATSIYVLLDLNTPDEYNKKSPKIIATITIVDLNMHSFDIRDKYITCYLKDFCRDSDPKYKGSGRLLINEVIKQSNNKFSLNFQKLLINRENPIVEPITNIKIVLNSNNKQMLKYFNQLGFKDVKLEMGDGIINGEKLDINLKNNTFIIDNTPMKVLQYKLKFIDKIMTLDDAQEEFNKEYDGKPEPIKEQNRILSRVTEWSNDYSG